MPPLGGRWGVGRRAFVEGARDRRTCCVAFIGAAVFTIGFVIASGRAGNGESSCECEPAPEPILRVETMLHEQAKATKLELKSQAHRCISDPVGDIKDELSSSRARVESYRQCGLTTTSRIGQLHQPGIADLALTVCGNCNGWERSVIGEFFSRTCLEGWGDARAACVGSAVIAAQMSMTSNPTQTKKIFQHLDNLQNPTFVTTGNGSQPPTTTPGRPVVLFHMSDEACSADDAWEHYSGFKLVLRQCACRRQYHEQYVHYANVHVVPLGYMNGFFSNHPSTDVTACVLRQLCAGNPNSTRPFAWSFVGSLRREREDAIKAFITLKPHVVGVQGTSAAASTFAASHFVLSPRGHVNLDCFRLYEASAVGAIPVVVGSPNEIADTFNHFHMRPPWVFATSWSEARTEVERLLINRLELRQKQISVSLWWIAEVEAIHRLLRTTFIICVTSVLCRHFEKSQLPEEREFIRGFVLLPLLPGRHGIMPHPPGRPWRGCCSHRTTPKVSKTWWDS